MYYPCHRTLGRKKVVMFPEIGRVKFFWSLTRPHSRMCIRIYIFHFKTQQINKQTNKKARIKKAKETKEEQWISPKNQFAAVRLKVFFITRISGNKRFLSFFLFFFLVLWRSFLPKFSILMNFYLFIVNIRFICDGEIYLLTYLLTYQVLLKLIYVILSILVHSDNMLT